MSDDRRLLPANGRVARKGLEGRVSADRYVEGTWRRVQAPHCDIRAGPEGPRDRQLLHGARFLALDEEGHMTFGQAEFDGYVGWVDTAALGPDTAPDYIVSTRATHAYAAPDIKSGDRAALSLGALLPGHPIGTGFVETPLGFVPAQHLSAAPSPEADPVVVAELLLGAPYLWGGNTAFGLDCSGLTQAAYRACGITIAGDSDLQAAGGRAVPDGAPLRRGDLVFWPGHVAMVRDDQTFIHANAHHMSVTIEDIDRTIGRIPDPVSARRRYLPD
ncbi:MAG: NlpC/P60 family protein [Pseudomonadota bacterium]